MGIFRPQTTVTGPDGRVWELYVSRVELPDWRPADGDDYPSLWVPMSLSELVIWLPFAILAFLWNLLIYPLLRFLLLLPRSLVRAGRSHTYRVEAITFWPREERLSWQTSGDQLDRVVRQIVGGLARGEEPRPLGATYLGSRSS